jgi:hypothetical protein
VLVQRDVLIKYRLDRNSLIEDYHGYLTSLDFVDPVGFVVVGSTRLFFNRRDLSLACFGLGVSGLVDVVSIAAVVTAGLSLPLPDFWEFETSLKVLAVLVAKAYGPRALWY